MLCVPNNLLLRHVIMQSISYTAIPSIRPQNLGGCSSKESFQATGTSVLGEVGCVLEVRLQFPGHSKSTTGVNILLYLGRDGYHIVGV